MHRPWAPRAAALAAAAAAVVSVGSTTAAAGSSALLPRAASLAACLRQHGAAVAPNAGLKALRGLAQRSTFVVRAGATRADVGVSSTPATAALVAELLTTGGTEKHVTRRGRVVLVGAPPAIARAVASCAPAERLPSTHAGRRIASLASGTPIFTVAGDGNPGDGGDGGPAASAQIDQPRSIAVLPDGSVLVVEPFQSLVRRIWPDGTITRFAGNGTQGYSGDGGPATSAELDFPHSVSLLPSGGVLLADASNHRIREIAPDGTITTVAGTGVGGYSGDGGPATDARIDAPRSVAALPDGGFLFVDPANQRVRRVWPDGTITTVAGTGVQGFSGDGGPATSADLSVPFAVAPTPDGGFLVDDVGNQRIRRVAPDGTITTVAGTGVAGYNGDGQPATSADLYNPHNVWPTADGGFLIADASNLRVRKVAADGTISTIAGTGVPGFSGDGGDAAAAQVAYPKAVVELPSGEILVADTGNNRLRYIGEPVAPTALSAPRVYGLPSPGRTLRASTGGWLVVPTGTYTYQWQRCDAGGAACADLAGETSRTYAVAAGDLGSTLRVVVTATNLAGSAAQTSAATAVVADLPVRPQNTSAPTISGSLVDGATLTADPGTWSGTAPIAYAYQWQRCGSGPCVDIPGANAKTYGVSSADIGSSLRVVVTATNAATANGYRNAVLVDDPVSYWRLGDGGSTLADSLGFRNGTTLLGPSATGGLVAGDADGATAFDGTSQYADVPVNPAWTSSPFSIEVLVRPSSVPDNRTIWSQIGAGTTGWWLNTGPTGELRMFVGDGSAWTSAASGVTLAAGQTYDIVATYDGSTVKLYVDGVLRATSAAVAMNGNVGLASMRFGAYSTGPGQYWPGAIDEASFYSAVLTPARVSAHAAEAASTPPGATSASTAAVAAAPPKSVAPPSVAGTPAAGQTLTGSPGTWSGTAPIALAERWQRCNGAGLACADIAGASGSSYTVAPPDLGHVLRYVVTASNAGGTVATSATVFVPEPATPSGGGGGGGGGGGVPPDLRVTWTASTATAPPVGTELWVSATVSTANVGASSSTRVSIALPAGFTVTRTSSDRGPGCTQTGPSTLTCDAAWIAPGTTTRIIVWGTVGQAGEQDFIATATSAVERELSSTLADNTVTLKLPAASPLTPPAVGGGAVTLRSLPGLIGTAVVGHVLRARPGVWSVAPQRVTYRWQLCTKKLCRNVGVGATLRLAKAYRALRVRVVETASIRGTALSAASISVVVNAPARRHR